MEQLRRRLLAEPQSGTYYCQTTELPKISLKLARSGQLARYLHGFRNGNFGILSLGRHFIIYICWWIHGKVKGIYARGAQKPTPIENLNLQPGELVEVKSMKSIIGTLDRHGLNRGLYFSPDMRVWCGRRLRVKGRLDKMIADGTGQMKGMKNTVYLEGATCGCPYMGLGMADCSRCEYTYWREIWLQRCDHSGT
jgi:hypothetical protein